MRSIEEEKGIEIANKKMAVPQAGVEIRYQKKPIHSESIGFVYLVLDSSGSMISSQKLNQARNGALKFAKESVAKGYHVGLIQFSTRAEHLCEPQPDLSLLASSLVKINAKGSTNMTDAINLACQKLQDRSPFRVMCIATDGFPDDPKTTLDAAQQAKEKQIEIIIVGTDDADQSFLKKLATRPEFGIKVSRDQFENAISSTAKMLPGK